MVKKADEQKSKQKNTHKTTEKKQPLKRLKTRRQVFQKRLNSALDRADQDSHQAHNQDLPLAKKNLSRRTRAIEFLKMIVKRIKTANISNNAKVLAYYTLFSIFPIIIVVGNLLPLLNIKLDTVMPYIQTAIPATILKQILPTIDQLLSTSSGGLLSFGIISTLWAASQGVNGLKTSFNAAYGVGNVQNALASRLISMLITFLMILILLVLVVVFTFGQQVLDWLGPILGLSLGWIENFQRWRWPVTLITLVGVLTGLYYFLPNVKIKLRTALPGAFLTTLGWLALAQGFSLYLRYFGTRWSSYGTIGTFIVLLLWLNFSGVMVLAGAVLNAIVSEYFSGKVSVSHSRLHDIWQRRKR